jgi:hypothetical protein
VDFKLNFPIPALPEPLNIRKPLLMLGSCFAEEIGEKLSKYKFNATINPHGILFNPLSIYNALDRYASNREYTEAEIGENKGLCYSFEHHGRFNCTDRNEMLQRVQLSVKSGSEALKNADYLVLTFGSAWVYKLKESGKVVANCHKVPQEKFTKELLTVRIIMEEFEKLYDKLMELNPSLKILMTVSPVKYLRDGLNGNNLSKAMLLLAVHFLAESYRNVHYFPAYEIVTDELRDYRFYETDFAHPNQLAIDYVWERFGESCFDAETKNVMNELKPLLSASEHRTLHPGTEEESKFKADLEKKWGAFKTKYPWVEV